MELLEYLTANLDLTDKLILDAALGRGKAASHWAEKVHASGGSSRIIAVDKDIPADNRRDVEETLGDYQKYVDIKEADIFALDFLADNSIDIINCHDTIVFLNSRPLKLLQALQEFQRVLKKGGKLLITSELPLDYADDPEAEGEWRRWTLLETVHLLAGEDFASFPRPQELKPALNLLGFSVYEERIFPGEKNTASYQLPLEETEEIVEDKLSEIPWPQLQEPLKQSLESISDLVREAGYLKAPDKFVIKSEL